MRRVLPAIAIIGFIVAIIGVIVDLGFDPLLSFLTTLSTLVAYLASNKPKEAAETLDKRNRRVMLDHVANFWVRGILEKSLHGAALLDLAGKVRKILAGGLL